MRSIVYGALCATALVMSASIAGATVASPGKTAAAATFTGVTLTNSFAPSGSIQLLKGKKKHLVMVDLTMVESTNAATVLAANVYINGILMDPGVVQLVEGCTAAFISCTLQGQFWADIDALEAANPGVFVGQPLTIETSGIKVTSPSSTVVTATISMRARMVKK